MLNHPLVVHFDAMLESQTDGVGTKVRIYMRQYNTNVPRNIRDET